MARYEYAEGTSNKFWEVELSDRKVTTTYGRIGVQGRTTVKEFDSPAKAQKAHDKLIAEKTAKGYQLVEEAGASARAAEPGAAAKPARAKRSATKSAGPQAPELVPTRPPPPTSERLPSPVSYGVPINATNAAGRRDGVWQMKLRDDEKTHELRFDNGYLAGLCRVFDGDGRLVGETHYRPRPDVYDQPTGPFCFSGWTMPGGASRSMRGGSSSQGTSYSYHANGAVAWQSPHDAEGVLDGFQRGWDKEGNLLAEKPYKGGLLDGWSYERQDDGSYKAQQWERGRLLLSEKQEERVINKIRKARDSYKKMDALEDFVPFDGRYPLLWHLVGTGKYPVAEDPELWGVLDDGRGYATAEQILTVVKAITKVDDNKVTTVIRGWPCSIDTMLQHVWFDLSPEQRESLAREVAPALRPGLLQLRARLGGSISDKDKKTILGLLADKEIFDYPCLDSVRLADENGQLTDEVRTPELRERYLRLFGSEEDWGRAILKRALKKGDSLAPERIRPGLLLADRSELARLLKEISCMANHEYSKVLEGRHDSPEDLLRVAQAIKPEGEWVHGGVDSMAEACFIEAARRCQETGQPLPEDLDRFIECKTYDHDCHADPPLRGLEPLRRALQVLPRPRLAAVLSRLLDNKYLFAQAGFALAVLDEPALLDKLVSCLAQVAADEKDIGQYRSRAFLAGQAGSWALPALEKALAASSNERERAIFWRTTVAAAAAMARAGEPIPERLDELVDWHQAVDQYDADWFWSHACRQILRGLPEKRAEAILLRALDAKQRHWTVPFTAF